ncbi:transporter [Flavobacterium akiainvivens]|uniref:Transporter n=1 Tax=Flavobacterium akiainvivens TaxID=1202724 RepID=A0A0M8MKG6_9FLAO|nr:TolC family protein [Flavobacterium akiainvivens]KOS07687.1 transporter [Flavobacterium akiainvivens]SFQ24258.1 outer membrane protein [Flavobacterium akiainvivens]
MRKPLYIALALCMALAANAQVKKWTLQECVEYAFKNNISVRQSELDLKTTEVTKTDALGNFLPSANFSGSHSWNIGLNPNPITGISQQQTTQFTTAGFSTQVDIYKGLQNQMQMRRSKMAIIAGQYQLQKMKDDIGLNVANAFLDVLFNKENLKVQQQQLQIDLEQAERSKQLLEGGQIPRGDLMDIEATVATDRQRVVQAENTLLISKLSLAQLLQLDDYTNFDVADEEYNMEDSEVFLQTPDAIYKKAREQRTEIKLAQANLDVAEQDVKIARGAYQPTLSGFYSLNTRVTYADYVTFNEAGLPITQSPPPFWNQIWDNKGHNFGFQLNIPILNGFATRNNVERAKISLERSKLAFEQQELDLERTIYQAFTDAQGALKAYDAAVSAAEARALSLNYAKERYGVGLINVFELNQAQTLSVNAQSEVVRSKYEFIFRVKILEFYFGLPIFQKQ